MPTLGSGFLSLTPEMLVPKIGDYLVSKGFLTPQDLNIALEYQKTQREKGNNILLGKVLVQLNMVEQEVLDQSVTEQILNLRAALQKSNQELESRVEERTKELQIALNRLSELDQLKSNIISNISHEFRTPLTHIKGYIDLMSLESLGPLTPEQKNALQVMHKSSIQLEELIDRMIHFSQIAKGEFELNVTKVDVLPFIRGIYQQNKPKAEEKKISLILLNIHEDLPPVRMDAEKITWVLLQLLDNAVKFTPAGGTISMGIEKKGALIIFSVTDTGIGIPEDRMKELFQPFHQLDSSSTRRYGGTGLGLALVKQILDAHGTTIQVRSQPKKGTRFEFAIPIARSII